MPHSTRRLVLATALVVSASALGGCATATSAPATTAQSATYPLTVDDCGSDVMITQRPERVLTVGTAAVELLDAAGASSSIVARTAEFGAGLSSDLTSPPSDDLIVDPADPTTESILGATPDLVYGYGLFSADPEQVRAAGIPLLTVQGECGHEESTDTAPRSLSTITADIRRLGTVFGTQATADASAGALDARIQAATRASTGTTGAWVYYFSSEDPLSAYGAGAMPSAVLADAGLDNVFADETGSYLTVSVESLLKAQPDWVVLTYGLYGESEADARAKLLAEPGIDQVKAVAAGRIVLVGADAASPSPSAVGGLEQIVAGIGG